IAHTDDDPNDADKMNAGNGGADYDEREYVDAGFLELVRLGIRRADDPLIAKSLAVVDKVLRVETPNGAAWYRYNHDGYGEMDDGRPWNFDGKYTGKGRLWALLSGERGQYELARGERAAARLRLDHMLGFANDGLMLPEQIWDRRESPAPEFVFGEGTGSATPLAWTMAQFIRLASNLAEGRNLETPDIVAARYVAKNIPADAGGAASGEAEETRQPVEAGTLVHLSSPVEAGMRVYALANGEAREVKVNQQGRVELDVRVPGGESTVVIGIHKTNGATAFRRITMRGLTKEELGAHAAATEASPALLERLRKTERSPVIEGDEVTFVYRGKAKRVEVVGDFTSWSPRGLVLREATTGADLKYLTLKFARDARVEYKLIADGEWTNDPLSDRKLDNGVGGFNNFFTMPDYRASALAEAKWELRGTVERLDAPTSLLEGGKRKIQIYLPPAYAQGGTGERFPVLYLQDGSEYATRARAAIIADQLISAGRVSPFIIVFVDPVDRFKEYWANDKFAAFMATELVPFVDARYRTRAERGARALMGASLGGVISVWTALKYRDVFARVAGQSTAFQIDDERVVTALASLSEMKQGAPSLRFYFDVGQLEPIWKVNRRVRVMLAGKNYRVVYRETAAGHNWTNWRDGLADAFQSIWNE
ncbi:MAG TPA: alpha/beta hydrolase-fold protein, partial [Pyrinomonadaceae bacterium]|nr:alpha/beta hydrolase-fold protein [Pyrinomonadaceae bacterium]